jgi:hypothetical protein
MPENEIYGPVRPVQYRLMRETEYNTEIEK